MALDQPPPLACHLVGPRNSGELHREARRPTACGRGRLGHGGGGSALLPATLGTGASRAAAAGRRSAVPYPAPPGGCGSWIVSGWRGPSALVGDRDRPLLQRPCLVDAALQAVDAARLFRASATRHGWGPEFSSRSSERSCSRSASSSRPCLGRPGPGCSGWWRDPPGPCGRAFSSSAMRALVEHFGRLVAAGQPVGLGQIVELDRDRGIVGAERASASRGRAANRAAPPRSGRPPSARAPWRRHSHRSARPPAGRRGRTGGRTARMRRIDRWIRAWSFGGETRKFRQGRSSPGPPLSRRGFARAASSAIGARRLSRGVGDRGHQHAGGLPRARRQVRGRVPGRAARAPRPARRRAGRLAGERGRRRQPQPRLHRRGARGRSVRQAGAALRPAGRRGLAARPEAGLVRASRGLDPVAPCAAAHPRAAALRRAALPDRHGALPARTSSCAAA